MSNWRFVYLGTVVSALVVGLGVWKPLKQAKANSGPGAPRFRVDPFWPKPLPSEATQISTTTGKPKPWVTGEVAGTCIDSQDHVFIVTRGNLVSPETVNAVASPPVIEFDRKGNVVNAWGDRTKMPNGLHGCFVDYQDNVWVAGNGDGIVQKFSHGGALLLQIGTRGVCDWPAAGNTCGNSGADPTANQSKKLLNQPADMAVDPSNGEVYIADGYGNHRVVVFNSSGVWQRQWGSVGAGNGQFAAIDGGHPHCVVLGKDNLVYACDRSQDRIEVFTRSGTWVKNISVRPGTGTPGLGTAGSAWDLDFSSDRAQSLFFEADGGNEIVWTFARATGTLLSGFGRPGHAAGEFTFLHTVSVDSKGNLFTGETINGRRIQKFVPRDDDEGDDD